LKAIELEDLSSAEDEPFTPGPIAIKKCKKNYESSRRFQESWAAKLPWIELHKGAE